MTYPASREDDDHAQKRKLGHGRRRDPAPLTFLLPQGGGLTAWLSLAWRAATLRQAEFEGRIAAFVRDVAQDVRVLLYRVKAFIAVIIQSFVTATQPEHMDPSAKCHGDITSKNGTLKSRDVMKASRQRRWHLRDQEQGMTFS